MKLTKYIVALCVIASAGIGASAKTYNLDSETVRYTRSSIYSVLVNHTEQKFADTIREQYLNLPTPDKYNNHDLSLKVVTVDGKGDYAVKIDQWIEDNQIASRLVGRWFERDIKTGECSMELIKDRGVYAASEFDKAMADRSERGKAMLQDAGENLIGQTFLLVHEINYVDRGAQSENAAAWTAFGGELLKEATGTDVSSITNLAINVMTSYKGFSVKIKSRLYQLSWDDETALDFYTNYYSAKPDEAKRDAFEANRGKFRLDIIGEIESKGGATSFMGVNEDEPEVMIRKALARAIDDNIADLQEQYEQFRIKTPILKVDPNITAAVGRKEGITAASRFEVLEAEEDEYGRIVYKKVGEVRPDPARIWDNRYMAEEEGAAGATLGETTFIRTSGKDFYPGMLIRQIKDDK